MSPRRQSVPSGRLAGFPAYVNLSSTTTSSPAASIRLTKCEPMNPAPPVTSRRTASPYRLRPSVRQWSLGRLVCAWGFSHFKGGFHGAGRDTQQGDVEPGVTQAGSPPAREGGNRIRATLVHGH